MANYGQLFEYIESQLEQDGVECDHTLRHTKDFAEMHDLRFDGLCRVLKDMGGYCDCEVLLNVEGRIPSEDVIGEETFKTPAEIAIDKGFYCNCRLDGVPLSCEDAMTAQKEGHDVQMHVPCGRDDPHSMPDLNRASASECG
jgi:hypothetical protein